MFSAIFRISIFAVIAIVTGSSVIAQQEGGGRAEPETVVSKPRVRRTTKPVVKRTVPKRTAPAVKTAEAYQAEGDKFYDAGDHDSALAAYQNAAKLKPLLKSFYRIGWIHNEFEEYQKAIVALDRAATLGPNVFVVCLE
jgi:hypothetical protein